MKRSTGTNAPSSFCLVSIKAHGGSFVVVFVVVGCRLLVRACQHSHTSLVIQMIRGIHLYRIWNFKLLTHTVEAKIRAPFRGPRRHLHAKDIACLRVPSSRTTTKKEKTQPSPQIRFTFSHFPHFNFLTHPFFFKVGSLVGKRSGNDEDFRPGRCIACMLHERFSLRGQTKPYPIGQYH